jgi:hypothetical protein
MRVESFDVYDLIIVAFVASNWSVFICKEARRQSYLKNKRLICHLKHFFEAVHNTTAYVHILNDVRSSSKTLRLK